MEYEFPTNVDLIIVGTGIIESILSAAASRIGKRVLHIDEHDYYGGQWASFNLEAIMKLKKAENPPEENVPFTIESNLYPIGNNLYDIKNLEYKFHVMPQKPSQDIKEAANETELVKDVSENPSDEIWDEDVLMKYSRKFNIDLTPKLQYARGDFVELLISSNIARYSEYRSVSRILTWFKNNLEFLPCSRSDVFSNTKVSVVEKRMLMKLLTSLNTEENELQNYENKTFKQFLIDKKLTPNLIHYVLYGISMSCDDTSCIQGVKNVKRFLNSLGRFGKTPFLFSMYGSGEIPQAFCRLSAVFGGIFALGQAIQGFSIIENKFQSVTVQSQKIEAEHLVMGVEKVPKQFLKSKNEQYISRCVLITDRSISESEKEHLTLTFFPPEDGKPFVTIVELGCLTGTCPRTLYVVHLIAKQVIAPQEDFTHVINNLFVKGYEDMTTENEQKPLILWSMHFSIPDSNDADLTQVLPENVFVCPGPDMDLDYDFSVEKAKKIFNEIYPDLEFLPRAPDPEEIVIEGDDETEETVETVKGTD